MSDHPAQRPLRLSVVQFDAVPQALTEHDRLWVPTEPLVNVDSAGGGAEFTADLSAARFFSASAGNNARNILRRLETISSETTARWLSQVLAFVTDRSADVVVLPEYLVPVECLDLLIGFSRRRALVGGLGIVRNREEAAAVLDRIDGDHSWTMENLVGRNVSVLIHNERMHVVTKRYPSEHEAAVPGEGPIVVEVNLDGRTVRLGVAVCMDYLRAKDEVLNRDPEIVCIPAFTSSVQPFLPDQPRDYVRLIANCAQHGGSTIVTPSLRGPVFTDRRGVKPAPAGCAAVLMIEHDRYERRPAALLRTENRLVLRAEVLERHRDNEVALSAVHLLDELEEPSGTSQSNSDLADRLSRWLDHLDRPGPLRDCLEEYRRALAQELDDPALYSVLSAHLTVTERGGSTVVRARQARFVVQRVGELMASGIETPPLGRFLDAYRHLADTVPEENEIIRSQQGRRWRFSLRLGPYDGSSAASTLPRQLNFLRAIGSLPQGSVSITYRLQSAPNPDGPDLRTYFDVVVDGDEDVLKVDQVESQLRSMLVASWPISTSEEPLTPVEARHFLRITLDVRGHSPAIREDWSSIIDLLRTHDVPIAVDLRVQPVTPAPDAAAPGGDAEDRALTNMMNTLNSVPYLNVGDEAERRAGAYFSLLRDLARDEHRGLGLSVVLASAEPIPTLLAETIKFEIFGTLSATVEEVDASSAYASPITLTPSELIRVFHPPYGRVQGRGVPRQIDALIHFNGPKLPAMGARLGTAVIAGPRKDRRADVLLDESARARHLYVVGRTGTGKTNFLKELCRQDLEAKRGLAVLDPHGDLVDYLSMHCQNRLSETLLLDFGRSDYIPLFNPLTVDVGDARSQALHMSDFLRILESRYYNEFTGPVFDDMVRQALETMFEPTFPVPRSVDLIEAMYRNREIRRLVAQSIERNAVLRDRWQVFEAIPEKEKAERIVWMLAKFADLLPTGSPLRASLCGTRPSPLSLEEVIWNQGVLLIKIPESAIGPDAASFLGSLLIRRIQRAVFDYQRGTGRQPADRPVFSLYIDEFQKFATSGIESLVAEARKFGCGLVLAHQNLEQLYAFSRYEGARSRELLNAILGNVGSVVAFRVGPQDSEVLADLLRTKPKSFDELPKYKALCRLTVDNDDTPCFTLTVDDASRQRGVPAAAERLAERMVEEGYWIPADEAADELDQHLARFEAALEGGRHAAAQEDRRETEELVQRLAASTPEDAEAIIGEFADDYPDLTVDIMRDLLSAVVAHHVTVPAQVRSDVVQALTSALVQGTADPAEQMPAIVGRHLRDADTNASARLIEALRLLVGVLGEADAADFTDVRKITENWVDTVLAGFVGAAVDAAHRRSMIPAVLAVLQEGREVGTDPRWQDPAVRAAVAAAVGHMRTAHQHSPFGSFGIVPPSGRPDHRRSGPFDVAEVPPDPRRVDFGALLVTPSDSVRIKIEAEDGGRIRRMALGDDSGEVQVEVFAAADAPLWPRKLADLRRMLDERGTVTEEVAGPYGPQLRYPVSRDNGVQSVRIVGVDGPGWMLQATFLGPAAATADPAGVLEASLRSLVVRADPGHDDCERLELRMPAELLARAKGNGPAPSGDNADAGSDGAGTVSESDGVAVAAEQVAESAAEPAAGPG